MTVDQETKDKIKFCIEYYEEHGLDWGSPVEHLVLKGQGHLEALKFGLEHLPEFQERQARLSAKCKASREAKRIQNVG